MRKLSVARLFEDNRDRLRLQWQCGSGETLIVADQIGLSPADLVGHLNTIHTRRIQVVGVPEILWVESVSPRKVEDIVGLYMDPPRHAVVLSLDEKSQMISYRDAVVEVGGVPVDGVERGTLGCGLMRSCNRLRRTRCKR